MIKSKTKTKNKKIIINPTGEWIKMKLSFRVLIQLQEYNKSLQKLLGFLFEEENKHILINLKKKDENFHGLDLFHIMNKINRLCDSGLEGKDRDWEIASNGNFFKPQKNKLEVNL